MKKMLLALALCLTAASAFAGRVQITDTDISVVMSVNANGSIPVEMTSTDIGGGLTRGLVLRVSNGVNVNYFNVKTNGDLVNIMYDVKFYEAAKQGVYGLGGRLTYAGSEKHGVTIRLTQGDTMDMIVQDDLTTLLDFKAVATFHLVD